MLYKPQPHHPQEENSSSGPLTSVASWCRLACSMSMCQSPWNRRRLLSHQGRGGLGSAEGLVKRSTHWPISVHAGSQHRAPYHGVLEDFRWAEEHRTQPVTPSPPLFGLYSRRASAHLPPQPSPPSQSNHLPSLLTVEVVIELGVGHVPFDGHVAQGSPNGRIWRRREQAGHPAQRAHQSTHQSPVTDLKQVPGIVFYPHC